MNTSYVDTSYGYNAASASGLVGGALAFVVIIWIISMAASILMIVSMWKVFKKLGKPGWASIVPIYNVYVLCCEIAEKEWWYILLLCVPFANIYVMYVVYDAVAKKFGKETGFTIGMMFLPIIFFPILAFSKDANPIQETASNEEPKTETMASENTFAGNETNPSQNSEMQNVDLEKTQLIIGQNEGTTNNVSNANALGGIPVMPISNNTVVGTNEANSNQVSGQENIEPLNQANGVYQAPTFDNNTGMVNNSNNTVGEVANNNSNVQSNYTMQANEPNMNAINSVPSQPTLNEPVNNQINEAVSAPNFDSFNQSATVTQTNYEAAPVMEQNINELVNNQINEAVSAPNFDGFNQSVNATQTNYEAAPVMEQNINEPVNNQGFTNESINPIQNVQENISPNVETAPVDNPTNEGHTSLWSNNNQNNTQN